MAKIVPSENSMGRSFPGPDRWQCPHCNGKGYLTEMSVGALVMARRKKLGLTQQDLSERSGLSRGQIANLETDRTDLSLKALYRVANALECKPKDLVP